MNQLFTPELLKKIETSNENEYLGKDKPVDKIKPLVSVRVQTYQHAKYIGQCLDGILMQETDFPYEVIVGEDESIDGTREICKEYAEKHPDKIRLFLRSRKDVIYSKGGDPTGRFNSRANTIAARGDYIAFCEGDDYWTDPGKLQKQFNIFKQIQDLALCIHATRVIEENGQPSGKILRPFNKSKLLSVEEVIIMGVGYGMSSVMYLKTVRLNSSAPFFGGHFALPFISASMGDVYYIDEIMSTRRRKVPGSYSDRVWDQPQKRLLTYKKMNEKLAAFDLYTEHKYSVVIKQRQNKHLIQMLYLIDKDELTPELRGELAALNLKDKKAVYIHLYFPFIRATKKKIASYLKIYFPFLYHRLIKLKDIK